MNWLKLRLKENSTYIGTVITAYAVAQLGPEAGVAVANLVMGVAGSALVIKNG